MQKGWELSWNISILSSSQHCRHSSQEVLQLLTPKQNYLELPVNNSELGGPSENLKRQWRRGEKTVAGPLMMIHCSVSQLNSDLTPSRDVLGTTSAADKPHHLVALLLGLFQNSHGKLLSGAAARFQKLGLLSSHHGLKLLKPCIARMLKNSPSGAASSLSAAQTQRCHFGQLCSEVLQELMARLKEGKYL